MKKKIIIPKIKEVGSPKRGFKYYIEDIVHTIIFCLCALFIGIVIGAFDAAFMNVLSLVTGIREQYPFYFIPFLSLAGLLIYFLFDRFSRGKSGVISLDFDGERDKKAKTKLRLIPMVIFGTWLTHLCGGSVGTENAAIQTGGTLGSLISRKLSLKNSTKILTVTGLAAAFGGLFGTPAAAIFFAAEVFSPGYIDVTFLLPAMISAYTSDWVSRMIGIEEIKSELGLSIDISVDFVIILCVSAIVFGIAGGLFAFLLKNIKKLLSAIIPNPYFKIFLTGFLVSSISLYIFNGKYSGSGMNIIYDSLGGGNVGFYDFILTFILTILTLSAGYQGGVFIPLFAIGASLGAVIAMLFNMPVVLFAAFGYAAVFGAATNTLLAPIFLGAEIFGYEYMPYFFVVCIIAYIFNGNCGIYTNRKNRIVMPHLLVVKK